MKKSILLFATLAFAAVGTKAQTADDIINKYADAIGGRKKLENIKNIYFEGSVDANGQKIPLKIWIVLNKDMRTEYTFGGMTGYSIIRSDSGWNFSPFAGQKQAEPMTADQVKSSQSALDGEGGTLLHYKEKKYKVTYEGKDDVDGTEAYKIEVVLSDSLTETYYFDPETYYVIRVHEKAVVNGKTIEGNTDKSDYQKTPEGYVFAMSQGGDMGGEVKFTTVKINTDMDPKLFSPTKQ